MNYIYVAIVGCAVIRLSPCHGSSGGRCSFNPRILSGTCSVQYTDPAASLIEDVFLSLAEADCELASPCDYPPHYSPTDWEEFDFIVVGAGSAGSVIANRLTEISGWTVLLIEAGGDPPKTVEVPSLLGTLQLTDVDWQYQTDPKEPNCLGMKGNRCNWPRGKMLGGCSSHNGLLYVRGNKMDYDGWESDGNVGWGYEDVLPYFKKSEDMRSLGVRSTKEFLYYHSIGGPLKIEDFDITYFEPLASVLAAGFAELGYLYNPDYNGKYQSGFTRAPGTLENGRRCSTAKAFLTPITFRSNIKLSKHSLVTKIIIDDFNKIAHGVEFIDKTGKTTSVLAKKEVIISAGTINSPQLLMLSGIGPSSHLKKKGIRVISDLSVGNNLQDHAYVTGLIVTLDYITPEVNEVENMFNFLLNYNNTYSSIGIDTFNVFINTENRHIDNPNIQYSFLYYEKNSASLPIYLDSLEVKEEIKKQFYEINSQSFTILILPALLDPRSRGNIRLQNTDPTQHPTITCGFFSDRRDVGILTKAINILTQLVNTEPLRAAGARLHHIKLGGCNRYQVNSELYSECYLRHMATTIYHPVGTCSMGPPGHQGTVVDPQLRVQGVDRLRVIDASVMPTVPRGNINAPTIMVAEKGSDLIKQTWLSTPYIAGNRFRNLLRYPVLS